MRFEKAIGNLRLLIEERQRRKLEKPQITILCTVMKQNIGKLVEMVEFAKQMGVDSIIFQPVVTDNTNQAQKVDSDTWIYDYKVLDENMDKVRALKKEKFFDFITSSIEQLKLIKLYFCGRLSKPRRCYIGFSKLIVTQDHKLYFYAPDPLTGEVSFGDVSKTPLRELWKSKRAREFRNYIKNCKNPCLLFCAYRTDFDEISDRIYRLFKNVFSYG